MNRKKLVRNLIAAAVALTLTAGYMAILEEATTYGESANAAGLGTNVALVSAATAG